MIAFISSCLPMLEPYYYLWFTASDSGGWDPRGGYLVPLHALHQGSDSLLGVAIPISSESLHKCCLAVSAGPTDQFPLLPPNYMVLLCFQGLVIDLKKKKKTIITPIAPPTSLTFPCLLSPLIVMWKAMVSSTLKEIIF